MAIYYNLIPESDPEYIGTENFDDQAEIFRDDFVRPENFDKLIKHLGSEFFWDITQDEKDWKFIIEKVKLRKKAICTDFLRFSPGLINANFLVSDSVKKILDTKDNRYAFFHETTVVEKDAETRYHLMYVKPIDKNQVDYKSCEYRIGDADGHSIIRCSNEEELSKVFEEELEIEPSVLSIVSDQEGLPPIINYFGMLFISSGIKDVLKENSITGIKCRSVLEFKTLTI